MAVIERSDAPAAPQRPQAAPPFPEPGRPHPIVTWAERAECTCPDACDRDHEQD